MFIIILLIMAAYYFFKDGLFGETSGTVKGGSPTIWYTFVHRSGSANVSAFEYNNIAGWAITHGYTVTTETGTVRAQPESHARHAVFGIAKSIAPVGPNIDVKADTTIYTLGARQLRLTRWYSTVCNPSYNVRFNTLEMAGDLLLASQTFAGCTPTVAVSYSDAQQILDLMARLPSLPKSHTFVPEEWVALPAQNWYACVKYNGVSCMLYKNFLVHVDSLTVCRWGGTSVDGLVYGELMPDGVFYLLDAFAIGTKNITNQRWSQRRSLSAQILGGIKHGYYIAAPDLDAITTIASYATEHKIDSDGCVFVSDSMVKSTITKKWKHYSQLTVDVLVDFVTGDLYSRDRAACVRIDAPAPPNLAEMRPPGAHFGVVECLVYPDWQITRLRTDKERPNAVITVQSIVDLAEAKIDLSWTKTKIEKLRSYTST